MTITQLLRTAASHLQASAQASSNALRRARHRLRRQVEDQFDRLLFDLYLRGVVTPATVPVPITARRLR